MCKKVILRAAKTIFLKKGGAEGTLSPPKPLILHRNFLKASDTLSNWGQVPFSNVPSFVFLNFNKLLKIFKFRRKIMLQSPELRNRVLLIEIIEALTKRLGT